MFFKLSIQMTHQVTALLMTLFAKITEHHIYGSSLHVENKLRLCEKLHQQLPGYSFGELVLSLTQDSIEPIRWSYTVTDENVNQFDNLPNNVIHSIITFSALSQLTATITDGNLLNISRGTKETTGKVQPKGLWHVCDYYTADILGV